MKGCISGVLWWGFGLFLLALLLWYATEYKKASSECSYCALKELILYSSITFTFGLAALALALSERFSSATLVSKWRSVYHGIIGGCNGGDNEMSNNEGYRDRNTRDWGSFILIKVVQPIIQIGTILFILYFIVSSVIKGFRYGSGLPVLSSSLIPFVLFAYIMHFKVDIIKAIFYIPGRAISIIAFFFGVFFIVSSRLIVNFASGPIGVLIFSTVLCLLLQISIKDIREKVFHLYYGVSLGFLVAIAFIGIFI